MNSQFHPGECVVCVDASGLPEPWRPLECGRIYIIRDVEKTPSWGTPSGPHKMARFLIRLEGIFNEIHPRIGLEVGYADTRFEKITPDNPSPSTRKNRLNTPA